MEQHLREKILNFLRSNNLAVISTIDLDQAKPEAALVAFAETEDLELIFQSFHFSRKSKNLIHNFNVAFVIGWHEIVHITMQYEGIAEKLSEDQVPEFRSIFLAKKTPCTEKFLFHPNSELFRVRPTWIGYSDYTTDPPQILEWNSPKATIIL